MSNPYGGSTPNTSLGNGLETRFFKVTANVEAVIAHKGTSAEGSEAECLRAFMRSVIGQKLVDHEVVQMSEEEYAQYHAEKRKAQAEANKGEANG